MEVALIGKAALIANISNIIPGAQTRFGELYPGNVQESAGRQACILLKGSDKRLFAQRKALG